MNFLGELAAIDFCISNAIYSGVLDGGCSLCDHMVLQPNWRRVGGGPFVYWNKRTPYMKSQG